MDGHDPKCATFRALPTSSAVRVDFLESGIIPVCLVQPLLRLQHHLISHDVLLRDLLLKADPISALTCTAVSPRGVNLGRFIWHGVCDELCDFRCLTPTET